MKTLKEAVQRKFKRDNSLDYALDEILIANGGKQIIFDALMASVNPGDEVVIPAPGWITYADLAMVGGATPVAVSCPENNQFKLRPDDLDAAITPRTKWVMLNFPNNPTGAACSRAEMQAIADVLLGHPHVLVLTDDIYEHLTYDGFEFCTIAEVEPRLKERTLTVNGASKAYAMTGWRVGFGGGPGLIAAMNNVQGQTGSGICTVSQAAAIAALDGPQDLLKERVGDYRERRDRWWTSCAKPTASPATSRKAPSTCFPTSPAASARPRRPADSSRPTPTSSRRCWRSSMSPRSRGRPMA